jgi:hypothetical protein
VDEEAAAANVVGEFNQADENVLEHSGGKPGTFVVDVHTEPGQ